MHHVGMGTRVEIEYCINVDCRHLIRFPLSDPLQIIIIATTFCTYLVHGGLHRSTSVKSDWGSFPGFEANLKYIVAVISERSDIISG